jgi:integrase/recombinase XerD
MNREVAITRRIGKQYYRVVFNPSNGTIKPGVIKLHGVEREVAGGSFYLSWYEGRKLRREAVGSDPTQAMNRRFTLRGELEKGKGKVAPRQPKAEPIESGKETLTAAVKRYLDEIRADIKRERKDSKTLSAYIVSLRYFEQSITPGKCVKDIATADMLAFADFLCDLKRKNGKRKLMERAVANKFVHVMTFLKWAGHMVSIPRGKRPRFVEKEVEVYERGEEMNRFWATCTPRQELKFRFLLQSGLRRGEFAHLTRPCLVKSARIVKVTAKPEFNWKPKKGRERSVPVPAGLIEEVLATMPRTANGLVFPDAEGNPDMGILEELKAVAKRAGMTERFFVHKFRASFATTIIRSRKVDLVTLASWMGQKGTKTLERYVKAAGGTDAQAMVEAVWG